MIEKMPKVELHLHLDGSVRITTASELCSVSFMCAEEYMIAPSSGKDLNDYLTKFDFPLQLLQKKEHLKRISMELGQDLRKENVIYAEIRFAPELHTQEGLTYEEIVDAVKEGLDLVPDLSYQLILCMMRQHSENINRNVIACAKKYLHHGVCAVDLAGAESLYPTKQFESVFLYAKELEVPYTIHAGEADGWESVEAALRFGAKRLGHGIRILESNQLIDFAKKNHITLEVCPTSNLQTGLVSSLSFYPIRQLLNHGLQITLNTDNRTVSNTTLTEEWKKMMDLFQLTEEEVVKMNQWAIDASFLSEDEKFLLKKKWNQEYYDRKL